MTLDKEAQAFLFGLGLGALLFGIWILVSR